MTEEVKTEEKKGIIVKLEMVESTDKKGEVIRERKFDGLGRPIIGENGEKETGDILYKRHDAIALLQMLNGIDTRKYDFKALKIFSNLKEKVDNAWLKDGTELDLTLDQAAFLKEYLEELNKKTNAQIFIAGPFHVRTMIAVKEQLDS